MVQGIARVVKNVMEMGISKGDQMVKSKTTQSEQIKKLEKENKELKERLNRIPHQESIMNNADSRDRNAAAGVTGDQMGDL